MKLAKDLMTSGVLGRGETRHCAEWEFPERARETKFGRPAAIRMAEARRLRGQRELARRGILAGTFFHFGGRNRTEK